MQRGCDSGPAARERRVPLLEDQPGVAEATVAHAAAAGALGQRDLFRRHAVEAGA